MPQKVGRILPGESPAHRTALHWLTNDGVFVKRFQILEKVEVGGTKTTNPAPPLWVLLGK